MDQLKAVVAQAIALLDALFSAYQASQQQVTTLQAQVADLQAQIAAGSGGTDTQAISDLTTQLSDAVTRDTPPPPAPPAPSGSGS